MEPNLKYMTWAIDKRADIQHTMVALYEYVCSQPIDAQKFDDRYLLDHLIAAAFALWRAVFLADTLRGMEDIRRSQERFLEKVITENTITFADDKANRHWTVELYLEGAKLRLLRAIALCDHYKQTKLHTELMRYLRLRGTGGVDLTQYEWECAHHVLRRIFAELSPATALDTSPPSLPR
jgi:hypothetical protein